MKEFKGLNQKEVDLLLKAPALVSVLAASLDGAVDEKEKAQAIKLSHVKTFSTQGQLQEYFKEVEKNFEKNFEQLNKDLPKDLDKREDLIKKDLKKLDAILKKLDHNFARALRHSLDTYKEHVSKVHRNALEFFALPLNFPGLTD